MAETLTPQQRSEMEALLKEIHDKLASQNFHPIVLEALFLLQDDEARWWPQGMPKENAETILKLLDEVPKQHTIFAVYDLIKVATVVGKAPGGTMAGGHLLRLCNDVIHDKNLIGVAKGDAEFAPGALGKAKDAIAAAPRAQPGKVGEKAPAGSFRIDQITPAGKRRL